MCAWRTCANYNLKAERPMNASCTVTATPIRPFTSLPAGEHLKTRLMEGLSKADIGSILGAATFRQYPSGSVVMNQEEPAEEFLLLRTGCARTFYITQQGRKVLLRWLQPGELLGGAALLPTASTYLVSTEVVRESSAFVWRRKTIRELTTKYPKLLDNTLPYALDHLTWFLAAQLALISNTASERLAQVLVSLAQGIGYHVSRGIRLDITNEQLANAANITPFTTSRILNGWKRSGAIVKSRGTIIIHTPERLFIEAS
jgi:CRP/FNR family transcriptional regulator, nitrogen oxide reductase regulator